MVNKQPRRRRSRGRPPKAASDDVRQALLAAGRTLFLRYGYRAVSSRQIAAAAGANTAMIRYYFGGKAGLYREMLDGVLRGLRERVDALQSSSAPADVSEIVEGAQRLWAGNPWIAGFVLREVLTPEAPMRSMFLREIGGRILPLVERVVTREIEAGRLGKHLDPKLVMLSMVSLAVFPFLAFQITSRVFGVQLDDAYVESLGRHTRALLAHGFKAAEDRS